jgi:hypothetical protein
MMAAAEDMAAFHSSQMPTGVHFASPPSADHHAPHAFMSPPPSAPVTTVTSASTTPRFGYGGEDWQYAAGYNPHPPVPAPSFGPHAYGHAYYPQ